jgi:hypothetical protein
MRAVASAGAGFLFAVLWFDLMFDVQLRGRRRGDVPADVLRSIAAYYGRVTTGARPMNRLVPVAMLATIVAVVVEIVDGEPARWRSVPSCVLVVAAVATAILRTVRNAVRLGAGTDDHATQERLARSILADHLGCAVAIGVVLVLQLLPA